MRLDFRKKYGNDCGVDGHMVVGLRSFSLDLDRTLPLIRGGRVDTTPLTTWLFSKVTALIGFASCPGLAVSFATNSNAEEGIFWNKSHFSSCRFLYFGILTCHLI